MQSESEPKKYILYCAQEANFQTRSMLIPYDLIMKCPERVKHLDILREHAMKNVEFEHRGEKYTVDQLLIENIIWEGGFGRHEKSPYSNITNDFTDYADWGTEHGVSKLYDKEWTKEVICGVASEGFNNVTNYCKFRNKPSYRGKPINIVEGFLVLEASNGKVEIPSVDTVEEMYEKYYS